MGSQPSKRRRKARFRRFPLGRPWCEALELDNGRRLIIRPIESGDAESLRHSFGLLTPEEIRFRFLHPMTELTPLYASQLATPDRKREFALIVVELKEPSEALIGAVVRAAIDDNGEKAEFAIIVGRELGGFGLGEYLMKRMIEWCRKKRLKEVYGDVMLENHRMLRLAQRLGFHVINLLDYPSVVRVRLLL